MSWAEPVGAGLMATGAAFLLSGTIGLVRFPDTLCRLHALTKADNLGLGFLALGAAVHLASPALAVKLVLLWLFALVANATSGYLIAGLTVREVRP